MCTVPFIGSQGAFTSGDPVDIANKASLLSLVSNTILYWNTIKITKILNTLQQQGHSFQKETLARISLLPYKHVLPNGTYFANDNFQQS